MLEDPFYFFLLNLRKPPVKAARAAFDAVAHIADTAVSDTQFFFSGIHK